MKACYKVQDRKDDIFNFRTDDKFRRHLTLVESYEKFRSKSDIVRFAVEHLCKEMTMSKLLHKI